MKFIKNVVGTVIVYAAVGIGAVIGYNAGAKVWESGLGDKVGKMSKKLFKGKEGS